MWQRYPTGLSMLIIYLMMTFRYLARLVHFQNNYHCIAAFLCINRDKPQLRCQGRCQLRHRLLQLGSRQQQKGPALQHHVNAYHPVEDVPRQANLLQALYAKAAPKPSARYSPGTSTAELAALFHPPQV